MTRLLLAASLFALAAAGPAPGRGVMLMNRIGPSKETLFVATADGGGERPLLAAKDRAFDYDANVSPDGRWVVFTSERDADGDGQADIYRVHPDGKGLERLTDDPAMDDQGALSPDGRSLAFVSTRRTSDGARTTNVWIMDLATKRASNLTARPELAAPPRTMHSFFRPSWSPDGRWIAFSSDRGSPFAGAEMGAGVGHTQGVSLYMIHPDGTGLRRLTVGGAATDGSPKWSPDSRRIVFYELETARTGAARLIGAPPSQIVSMDVETGARAVLTDGPGLKIAPQYVGADRVGYLVKAVPGVAQPGRLGPRPPQPGQGEAAPPQAGPALGIAYVSATPPAAGGKSAPPVLGTAGNIRNPSWSPDGAMVVYQRFDITNRAQNTRLHSWDPNYEYRYTDVFPAFSRQGRLAITDLNFPFGNPDASISAMDADGSHRVLVFHDLKGAAMTPSWSPDGRRIAFSFGTHFGGRSAAPAVVMVADADGRGAEVVPTPGAPNAGFPSWSPDGRRIIYRAWGGTDVRGIREVDLKTHEVRTLTTQWDNFPFYSPSGDSIVFTRQDPITQDFDIWTMRPDGSGQKQITFAAGADSHANWTADGKQLWFYSSRGGFKDEAALYDTSPQPYAQVFLMNRDGSNVRQLTDSRWEDSMAAFAPERRTVPKP